MSEVKETSKGLQALFSRPRKFYEKIESGRVEMTSSLTDMVYIRACRDCELRGTTKLAKCIIESCSNMKVALQEPIMSGTLEMIDCKNVSVFINPRDSIPTISAERCETLHFYLVRPEAMGSIYTAECDQVTVHFKPPHREEYVLELPGGGAGEGEGEQLVSYLSGEDMVTERVVREGGGYATMATKLAEAEKKQKELMRRFEEHVLKMLNLGPPPSAAGAPPSSGGASSVQTPPASRPQAQQETTEPSSEPETQKQAGGEEKA